MLTVTKQKELLTITICMSEMLSEDYHLQYCTTSVFDMMQLINS